MATKQLLETLTQWSRQTATEAEVSDVYVRLGYEFNIACRAFTSIGVETSDLGPVPDLLRTILEETLSQEANPQSLDKFLPRIRDIIINLLHGLKKKQQRLRLKQTREGSSSRQSSVGSVTSGDNNLGQVLEDVPSNRTSSRKSGRRYGNGENVQYEEQLGIPARTSSAINGRVSPVRQDTITTTDNHGRMMNQDSQRSKSSTSGSSMSSNTMQNLPVLLPEGETMQNQPYPPAPSSNAAPFPAPPPAPREQDALAALQRGGDLERRASRRFSAYQISKHLGASPHGVPMLPSAQSSPAPNRGRDVRESMNAVRTRGSLSNNRQRSTNRFADGSPRRNNLASRRISEETSQDSKAPTIRPSNEAQPEDDPIAKTPEDKIRKSYIELDGHERPGVGANLGGPLANGVPAGSLPEEVNERTEQKQMQEQSTPTQTSFTSSTVLPGETSSAVVPTQQFTPEQSPPPGKELTLFLQYKSKIKKFVLPEGYSDLSVARLQLAFIEKFAWNTHNNGNDLPEIYIQDPVSGVRHELEDLGDIKDRSVLVLNVEVLDEVKRHIDEGLGGLRRMVEGVRTVVDGQQSALQRVSDRQQDTAKEMARLAAAPAPIPTRRTTFEKPPPNGLRSSSSSAEASNQLSEIQSLRRDLAVVRQSYSSFTSDISTSMETIRSKAASVKAVAKAAAEPLLDASSGRAYLNTAKKSLSDDSEKIVNRVDDLQDVVEDLRKDVVTRGVRPLPRQLEVVSKDISTATAELKKMQEFLKRERPIWNKIWAKELDLVCTDRDLLTMQEDLAADLEDDLEKATQTFALVEQATKEQHLQNGPGGSAASVGRSASRGLTTISTDQDIDPVKAKDGVLGEVRALQPNHETRLEAIERSERARRKELESRRDGEFQKELGSFVEEGKLKKSGGVEEAERMRKAKDEKIRTEVWERQQARAAGKGREAENSTPGQGEVSDRTSITEEESTRLEPAITDEEHGKEGEAASGEHGKHTPRATSLTINPDSDPQYLHPQPNPGFPQFSPADNHTPSLHLRT